MKPKEAKVIKEYIWEESFEIGPAVLLVNSLETSIVELGRALQEQRKLNNTVQEILTRAETAGSSEFNAICKEYVAVQENLVAAQQVSIGLIKGRPKEQKW